MNDLPHLPAMATEEIRRHGPIRVRHLREGRAVEIPSAHAQLSDASACRGDYGRRAKSVAAAARIVATTEREWWEIGERVNDQENETPLRQQRGL